MTHASKGGGVQIICTHCAGRGGGDKQKISLIESHLHFAGMLTFNLTTSLDKQHLFRQSTEVAFENLEPNFNKVFAISTTLACGLP